MSHLDPHSAPVDATSAPLFSSSSSLSLSFSSSSDDELEDEGVITLAQDAEPQGHRKLQKQQEKQQDQRILPKSRISFKTAGKVTRQRR
jgi:hypothetical protein